MKKEGNLSYFEGSPFHVRHFVPLPLQDGFIEGASGRKLRVNPSWSNPTGEWRVGSKHVYKLFSAGLVTRFKEERRRSSRAPLL